MTNQEIKKTIGTTDITSRAMLVNLTIHNWNGCTVDTEVQTEVTRNKGARRDGGRWYTHNIPKDAAKEIRSALNRGKAMHDKLTLPWNNDGARILPADMFMTYTEKMRELKVDLDNAVETFLTETYPAIVERAKERLQGLYKPENFPTTDYLRTRFGWDVTVMPLPTSSDFRVQMCEVEAEKIRATIDDEVNKTVNDAVGDVWKRLFEVVNHVAERLSDPKARIFDSMITNLTDLCDLLPVLNITGDAELTALEKDVRKKIGGRKPEELRNNPKERKQTAKDASAIVDKMKAFMGTSE